MVLGMEAEEGSEILPLMTTPALFKVTVLHVARAGTELWSSCLCPWSTGIAGVCSMLGLRSSFVSVCGPRLSQMLWALRATRSEQWRSGRVMSFVPDKGLKRKRWRVKCSAGNGGWSQWGAAETVANSLTRPSV